MSNSNVPNLNHAIEYLEQILTQRILVQQDDQVEIEVPSLGFFDDGSNFGNFIRDKKPNAHEYIVLLLTLVQHIQPTFLGNLIKDSLQKSGNFSEIGGKKDDAGRYFIPTGETALFILAGEDLNQRLKVQSLFSGEHWFAQLNILHLEPAPQGEPYFSGRIILAAEYIERFTTGQITIPRFSSQFPAQRIQTEMEWEDLVLSKIVMDQIEEIKLWVQHKGTLMEDWGMHRILKPGYKALFHGPPGTGKTLTAKLLGKHTNQEVFRVDLSTVISKFIGETEKNLANLFDKAEHKNWILFFDEADALFGKRTNIKNANDRFANQEVSFLLQRIEDYPGLVILASNFRANMDEAFLRRFNIIIKFPIPGKEERLLIWKKAFPPNVKFQEEVDIHTLASRYELAGGSIINVVQYACLQAIAREEEIIHWRDILQGIRREIQKEGKIFKEK